MNKKTKDKLYDVASGAGIGIAAAIPGVSGGTIAVMMHVYDRHLDHMNNLRKKFWPNLLALLPLLCGIIVGVVPAVILFKFAFEGFVFGIVSLFAGLIIGGLPGLFDEIKLTKIKPIFIVIGFITLAIAILLGVFSVQFGDAINLRGNFNMSSTGDWINDGAVSWWLYLVLIPIGMIAAVALIVPGISGSMILLVTGFYNPLLDTLSWWKDLLTGQGNWWMFGSLIGLYGCFLIGIIIGFFTIVKLMQYLLNKFRVATFYGIIGFVLGSLFSLYYNNEIVAYYQNWTGEINTAYLPMGAEIGIGIGLLIVGIAISFAIYKYGQKIAKQNQENKNGD